MENNLRPYGEFLLNPNHITEIEFTKGKAIIYLSDGRTKEIAGATAMALKDLYTTSDTFGDYASGVPYQK